MPCPTGHPRTDANGKRLICALCEDFRSTRYEPLCRHCWRTTTLEGLASVAEAVRRSRARAKKRKQAASGV
jgi:hypothetical protein